MTPAPEGSRSLAGALHGLTNRGRAFLAAGTAAVAAAVLFGQRDVLRVGVLLLALPLICAWAVTRTRYRLACTRRLDPARVGAGEEARVVLDLDNVSRLATGLLLVEDRVPYVLGARPRFVLDRVESRGRRSVGYTVRSEVRGRFPLGPLSVRLTDPFGMCELERAFSTRDRLTVTPRLTPLPSVALGGEWTGSGESRSRSMSAAGEDDVSTREYRHGDPLHRVHWRSSARFGELMVRREEQPWQSRATLLLDTRARAHRGEGAASSFEWAVAAAASLGVHLVQHGFAVRLVTDTGASVSSAAHDSDAISGDFEGVLLDALSVIAPHNGEDIAQLRASAGGGAEGLLVAVLGRVTVEQAQTLARARAGGSAAVGVLLDTSTWTRLPARQREEAARTFEGSATLLRGAGWRVLRAQAGDDLAALWPRAARGMGDLPPGTGTGSGAATTSVPAPGTVAGARDVEGAAARRRTG